MPGRTVSPTIIARDAELTLLARSLDDLVNAGGDDAATPPPDHLIVAGEAGIGKTRLVEEVRRLAETRGCLVLRGAATDLGDGDVPYGALVEVLRRLTAVLDPNAREAVVGSAGPDLARLVPALAPGAATTDPGDPIGVGSVQSRILEALLGTLQRLSARGPVVIIVEDLHWADPATRDALAFLIRNLHDEPILLVLTVRSDDLFRRHPLVPWLAEAARSGRTQRLDLARLDAAGTASLVTGMVDGMDSAGGTRTPAELAAIHARSDGNPFFIEELVMAAAPEARDAPLPPTLTDVLTARIAAAPSDSQAVLGVIAVSGRTIDHDLLVEVADVPEEQLLGGLRAAIERQLLVVDSAPDEPERYAFRHALLAEAAYDDLLPAERRRLHRRIATALAARPAGDGAEAAAHWSTLASHWSAARDETLAFEASVRAGVAAASTFAFAAARRQFERAVDGWDEVDDPVALAGMDRATLLTRAAQAAWLMGDARQAVAWRREAAASVDPDEDPVRTSLLLAQLAQALWHHGISEEAVPVSERAVATMPADARTPERARVLAGHAKILMLMDRLDDAIGVADEAIDIAVASGARAVEGHARATRGLALSATWRCAESIADAQLAVTIATETRDPDDIGRSHINHAEGLLRCGLAERSLAVLEGGLKAATEVGVSSTYGRFIRADAALASLEVGRWDDARRYLDDPFVHEVTSPQTRRYELGRHVGLLVGVGDPTAGEALDELWELLRDTPVESQFHAPYWFARIEHELWSGRPADALAAAHDGLAQLATNEWRWVILRLLRLGARAAADVAALERARRRTPDADDAARVARGFADRVPALIAAWPADGPARDEAEAEAATIRAEHARADGADDATTWLAVVRRWSAIGRPPVAAYAGWRAAETASAAGDRTMATSAAADATRIASALGAGPLGEALRSLVARGRLSLDASGPEVGPTEAAASSDDDPFGLTERERAVLALVAQGYTNRRIGGELFISESTAGVHVSNILGKLGVASRTEAAAIAVRLGLAG